MKSTSAHNRLNETSPEARATLLELLARLFRAAAVGPCCALFKVLINAARLC